MANPSLQIGNDNWAIKEDNLLGYSTAGTRFVPEPITMTRASAGTRVNPEGLVETVELLGSELVTNGDFATDTDWSKGTGWTISGGSANCDGSQSSQSNLYQTGIVPINISYKVTFTTTVSAGGVTLAIGGSNAQTITTESGTYTFTSKATSGDSNFYFSANSDFIGSISNVSVKEATIDGLARVDYTDGTGSLLVEPQRANLIPYSEDLTNGFYLSADLETVTESTTLSPDGTSYGYTITPTSSAFRHYFNYEYGQLTVVIGDEVTYSIFVKPNGYNFIQIASSSGFTARYQNFELTGNGVIGTGDVNGKTIEKIGDWYRCSVTETSTGVNPRFLLLTSETALATRNPVYSGNATDGVLGWGVQVEVGSYPTSYIKTQGSSVTRNQDEYTKTGISDKINSEEGVLFVEMAALSDDNTDRRITLSDGLALNNTIIIGISRFTGNINAEVYSSGVLQTSGFAATGVTQTNNNKFALSWGSGTMKFYVNGSPTSSQTGITSPTGLDSLKFSLGNDTLNLLAKVKQLQVFKTALSDSELATLTTI